MSKMIKGIEVLFEKDEIKRNKRVDKLTLKDARLLLKMLLPYVVKQNISLSDLSIPKKSDSDEK